MPLKSLQITSSIVLITIISTSIDYRVRIAYAFKESCQCLLINHQTQRQFLSSISGSVYGYAKRKTARHRLAHIDTPEVPTTLQKRRKSSDRCWVTSFACIVRFAEDLSYPKSRRGRIMVSWL